MKAQTKILNGLRALILFFSTFLCSTFSLHAQVDVVSSLGQFTASYSSLKLAFDAINSGLHKGVIQISISANTTETASAVLNSSGSGAASYTGITIQASGVRTISGNLAAPLISLNGADHVILEGLNSLGNSLSISNTSTASTSGTCTLLFIGDATQNSIRNCDILGSATIGSTTNGGTVFFSTGTSVGNDSNTISNCRIGAAGSNTPTKAIYANGSTANTGIYNSGNRIENNEIYDYFNPSSASSGIYLNSGNADFALSGNRFYQSAVRTQSSGALHTAIQCSGGTGNTNHAILNNIIGYGASNQSGIYTIIGASTSSRFCPIYLSSTGSAQPNYVSGNIIDGISFSGPLSGTGISAPFIGIYIGSAYAQIGTLGANRIGNGNSHTAISFSSSSSSGSDVVGIYFGGTQSASISNNLIAGINAGNTSTGAINLYGIRENSSNTLSLQISRNTIGSENGNLVNSSSASGSKTIGIQNAQAQVSINENQICYITCATSNTGTGANASLIGILAAGTALSANQSISGNKVFALSNTHASAAISVCGLYIAFGTISGTQNVSGNFIHSLSVSSNHANADIKGIHANGGANGVYSNNIIRLGIQANGVSLGNGVIINGIYEQAGTGSFVFNTIYIGGSGVLGSSATYALQSLVLNSTRVYKNNIFYNARSNSSGTGKHYACKMAGTAANPTGLSINCNAYYAGGNGGVLGYYNGVDISLLSNWKSALGQDAGSMNVAIVFVAAQAGAAQVSLQPDVGSAIIELESAAEPISGISSDYTGAENRLSFPLSQQQNGGGIAPDIGAYEFDAAPAIACSFGAGSAGNTLLTESQICYGGHPGQSVLSVQDTFYGNGIGFQWQCASTQGGTYTNIAGATLPHYTVQSRYSLWYKCLVSCGATNASQYSVPGFVQVNLCTQNVWTGASNSNWFDTLNWQGNWVPTLNDTVRISLSANLPSLQADASCKNLQIDSGAILYLNGNVLSLYGTLSGTGTISGYGTLQVLGSGAIGTLFMNQLQSGSSNKLKQLLLNRSNETLLLGNALKVKEYVSVTAGTLNSASNLCLLSDSSGDASIAAGSGNYILGDVIVQRYIPGATSGRNYRYLSAPFSNGPSIANSWQQQIFISGNGSGGSICPSLSPHSNGFDATATQNPSMLLFNESTALPSASSGNAGGTLYTNAWESVPNTLSTQLIAGKGYNVFIRGSRAQGCGILSSSSVAASDVILSASGEVQKGAFTYSGLGYHAANGDGWNLVGNPYPSAIDWDHASWTKTNLNASIWVYVPATNSFATYTPGVGGVNGGSNIIPMGTAFFIHAYGTPGLALNEQAKTSSTPATSLLKTKGLSIQLVLENAGKQKDAVLLIEKEGSSYGFDPNLDAEKMWNPNGLNLYALTDTGKKLAIASMPPIPDDSSLIIPLGIGEASPGSYAFKLAPSFFSSGLVLILKDHYLQTERQLLAGDSFVCAFTVSTDSASRGNQRFELKIENRRPHSNGLESAGRFEQAILVYPNPFEDYICLKQLGKTLSLKIVNELGQSIYEKEGIQETECFDLSACNNAVLNVRVINENGAVSVFKIVKQQSH